MIAEPTVETLTAWMRGDLRGEARHQVTTWLVTCTDPRLPALLFGLERRIAIEGWLSKWTSMVDLTRAFGAWATNTLVLPLQIRGEPSLMPALGVPGELETRITCDADSFGAGAEVRIGFDLPQRSDVAMWAVTSGVAPGALAAHTADAGRHRDVSGWTIDPADGEVSIWLFVGPPGSLAADLTLPDLMARVERGEVSLVVGCWESDDG